MILVRSEPDAEAGKVVYKVRRGENLILPAVRTEELRTILPKLVAEPTLHHREKSHANRLLFEWVVSVYSWLMI